MESFKALKKAAVSISINLNFKTERGKGQSSGRKRRSRRIIERREETSKFTMLVL
jgi:hypothetical protein